MLNIQLDKIEEEAAQLPDQLANAGRVCFEAKLEKERAKQALQECKADLDGAIRSNPAKFNLPKVTDASVETAILREPAYKEMLVAYNEANEKYEKARSFYEDGMRTKKEMVLALADFRLSKAMEESNKSIQKKIGNKLK
jgi:hypothetical protein